MCDTFVPLLIYFTKMENEILYSVFNLEWNRMKKIEA